MTRRDVVVIGASSGGLQALQTLVGGLPAGFPAAVFIVLHVSPHHESILPLLLSKAGPLPASHALDREPVTAGRVYVAPPGHHLVLEPGHVRLTRGPRENRVRPAIDPLFRSAAYAFGARVVGVILTGALDDGTAGLWAIKDRGGVAVVQDPAEAEVPSMPQSALRYVEVDYCLEVARIAPALARLAWEGVEEKGGAPVSEELGIERRIALGERALEAEVLRLGEPSPFTCPECHGSLVRLRGGGPVRFRCHTGHAYTLGSLLEEVVEGTEDALWGALRAVQEKELLLAHMARHAREAGELELAEALRLHAHAAQQQADLVRRAVLSHETSAPAAGLSPGREEG